MQNESAAPIVTDAEIERFISDGVVMLPGLFTDWVAVLQQGIEANMASPSGDVRIYRNDDDTGLFFGDYCNWNRFPEYRDFIYHSPAGALASRLTRSSSARLFHEHVLVKEPGTTVRTPWHHDQPYYCVNGTQTCSLWLALDPVPRNTCVEFVVGSHRWGTWFRPERFNKTALNEDDGLSPVSDIENNRERYEIVNWNMAPGDVIAFNFLTLHGAPANKSVSTRRRAFSSRWIGDDCTYAKRPCITSPPFPDLDLNHGAPMDNPRFPLVFES